MTTPNAAIWNKTNQAFGVHPNTGAALTKNVSPAAGIVPSALSGDARAGAAVTASVLGTGINADILTYAPEAV